VKQIVISLIDRLAGFAAREAENETPEEKKAQEEELSRRLADRVRLTRESQKERTGRDAVAAKEQADTISNPAVSADPAVGDSSLKSHESTLLSKGKSLTTSSHPKFRGIPEDVRLFEIFWQQVVQLISVSVTLSQ